MRSAPRRWARQGSCMSQTNTQQERTFFDAVSSGQIDTVRALAAQHPELLDAFDYQSFGATPVTSASFAGSLEMLKALIALGADLDKRSDWSMGPWSPLHCAAFTGNHALSELLLEHGATLDLHAAAGLGRTDDAARLLDESPERVREGGGDGCHPLHFAHTPEMARLLLDRGADIEARCTDHYSTPAQYLAHHRSDVARFLFREGARADIFSAVLSGDEETVTALLADDPGLLGVTVGRQSLPCGDEHDVDNIMTVSIGEGCTPLHAAAKGNRPRMVDLLVGRGLSPNARGGYDESTPLHTAAWEDHAEAALALVENGADINARSGAIHKNSPAGWAIVAGSANVFERLMDCGAEVLESFLDDAQAGVDGKFAPYKCVDPNHYARILKRLQDRSG